MKHEKIKGLVVCSAFAIMLLTTLALQIDRHEKRQTIDRLETENVVLAFDLSYANALKTIETQELNNTIKKTQRELDRCIDERTSCMEQALTCLASFRVVSNV